MNSSIPSLRSSSKADEVREMFAHIAPRYDFLNHALSLNVDKRWRKFLVRKVQDILQRQGAVAIDLCCGTCDLAIELASVGETIGMDFCQPMLAIGARKVQSAGLPIALVEADALNVPVADNSVDVVTVAFGLRNLDGVEAGLKEMFRILKPGGRAAVLEFSHPKLPLFRSIFNFYFTRILPRVGNAVSGSNNAYRYLPESVEKFPDQAKLLGLMKRVGFSSAVYHNLFGGVVALHLAEK